MRIRVPLAAVKMMMSDTSCASAFGGNIYIIIHRRTLLFLFFACIRCPETMREVEWTLTHDKNRYASCLDNFELHMISYYKNGIFTIHSHLFSYIINWIRGTI